MHTTSKYKLSFNYTVKRSKRKTMAIHIRDCQAEVRAPFFVTDHDIFNFIKQKSDWITQQINEQKIKMSERPIIAHGNRFLFLGRSRPIEFIQGPKKVYEKEQTIVISYQSSQTNNNPQKQLENWLKKEAKHYLIERTHEIAETMGETNSLKDIIFRKTKSKWGHCTSSGRLQFNWLIIMASPEVIDYLIIHELCHFKHMNHSKLFWQHVIQFCPDYKIYKKWLNDNGHKLSF